MQADIIDTPAEHSGAEPAASPEQRSNFAPHRHRAASASAPTLYSDTLEAQYPSSLELSVGDDIRSGRTSKRPPLAASAANTSPSNSLDKAQQQELVHYYRRRLKRAASRALAPFSSFVSRRLSDPVIFSIVSSQERDLSPLDEASLRSRAESAFTSRRASDPTSFGFPHELESASRASEDDSVLVPEAETSLESLNATELSTLVSQDGLDSEKAGESNSLYCEEVSESEEEWCSPASSYVTISSFGDSEVCVVCMDNEFDIALQPCGHTACCAACFMRLESQKCPVCRSQADAAHFLGIDRILLPRRFCQATRASELVFGDRQQAEQPTHRFVHLPPRSGTYHCGPSVLSIARQAAPSLRNREESRARAFRAIQSAVDLTATSVSNRTLLRQGSLERRTSFTEMREVASPFTVSREPPGVTTATRAVPFVPAVGSPLVSPRTAMLSRADSSAEVLLNTNLQPRNVVLMGSSSALMAALVRKLQSLFGAPAWESAGLYKRDRSLLYIANEPLRLVVLERRSDNLDISQFVEEVRSYSPHLVLLCADLFIVTSFELLVRLDLEVLDSLEDVPCMWVLIKHNRSKHGRMHNRVESADVAAAQHYLSHPRRWFVVALDRLFAPDMKKLGRELHAAVWANRAPEARYSGAKRASSLRAIHRRRTHIRSLFRRATRTHATSAYRSVSFSP